jgi:hypothetical protein
MKKLKFTEPQIPAVLKHSESGVPVPAPASSKNLNNSAPPPSNQPTSPLFIYPLFPSVL